MTRRSGWTWLLVGLLCLLVIFSVAMAVDRIYQADEAQNLFMARILGTHQTGAYSTNAELWLLGPMAWLARSATVSATLFFWGRMIFLGVFWINLLLLALNAQARPGGPSALLALAGAATLAPLWDYGLEIRHDNLLLMGLLLIWYLGRTRPGGKPAYAILGFLTVLLQFIAFKSFVYTGPLALAFLAFPPPGHRTGRGRLILAWGAGALAAFLVCRLVYHEAGLWTLHAAAAQGTAIGSMAGQRFGPWMALRRLLDQTPLLLAVAAGALVAIGRELARSGRTALTWDGPLPEALLCLGSLVALAVNPTPFPYNLVNVVPFAFLLAARILPPVLAGLERTPMTAALLGGILAFTHGAPFLAATWRHLGMTNQRQERLMGLAEALTDPVQDRVYDGIGMVPTRASIHAQWYLHSLNIKAFQAGGSLRVRDLLARNPPAVIIPTYRWEWLPAEDMDYVRAHYVPLAEDFWVLGQRVAGAGGRLDILHGGRYLVCGQAAGAHAPMPGALLDGHPVTGEVVRLEAGIHQLTCPADTPAIAVWVGPTAESVALLEPGRLRTLFVNWY